MKLANLIPIPIRAGFAAASPKAPSTPSPSSYRLLRAVNRFIAAFLKTPERAEIGRTWQGKPVAGNGGYRTEPGGLLGEAELAERYAAH